MMIIIISTFLSDIPFLFSSSSFRNYNDRKSNDINDNDDDNNDDDDDNNNNNNDNNNITIMMMMMAKIK